MRFFFLRSHLLTSLGNLIHGLAGQRGEGWITGHSSVTIWSS